MAETNLEQLKRVLDELFMFDRADLDFGLYRIMNVRREEIRRFLDRDLLSKVREALGEMAAGDRAATEAALHEAMEQARALGFDDPSTAPKVRELQAKYDATPDSAGAEAEVYGHLASFFRRYYREGDFISLRRYKEGVYAIPYEGEEVKLHWANADQYYIKSTEQFRDYTFLLPADLQGGERRVHFKLVEADTERNNNRAQAGEERRFILAEDAPVVEQDGELVVRFEYRADAEGRKQKVLNEAAEAAVLGDALAVAWVSALSKPAREEAGLTVLARHINAYAAKNTFDYFIHKDLGGFLRRELDFYLKNEVMHLDDIDTDGATGALVEAALRKLRAIRGIARPVIDFLASLEEFQKRLWLKKKLVVETHWCVTLDRVPHDLYPQIAANEAQREEWVRLFGIEEIKGDLVSPAYSVPLTVEFLTAHPYLVVDTSLFEPALTEQILREIDDLDAVTDGLLVHGDNFQALNLLRPRYAGEVQCIYIDPPYNSDAAPILYKNDYPHSSWLSLVSDRLAAAIPYGNSKSILCVTIDDAELPNLLGAAGIQFGASRRLATVPIRNNPQGRSTVQGFAVNHEYALFYALGSAVKTVGRLARSERQAARYDEKDDAGKAFLWDSFRKTGTDSYRDDRRQQFFPIFVLGERWRVPEMHWDRFARDWILDETPKSGEVVLWPIDDDKNERVWKWGRERTVANPDWIRVVSGPSGPRLQYRLYPNESGKLPGTWWDAAEYGAGSHGTNLLTNFFGRSHQFDFPKSVYATMDCLRVGGVTDGSLVLDFFAGSGTTGHAVISMNRDDGEERKYVLVEMGEYFDTVLKSRVLKAVYSKDWRDGKPVSREGVSQLIKVIRLESYEDTLSNLRVRRTQGQTSMLESADERLREQYTLRYWISAETQGSPSLLDISAFDDPWSYTLDVGQGSAAETRPVAIDLVETFNYLVGLRVKHVDRIKGVTLVEGTLPASPGRPSGEKAIIIWRNTKEMDAEALDEFLADLRISSRDLEFDVIYVNGDNHLENMRRADETWKVRLIEDEFQRLMFETAEQEQR